MKEKISKTEITMNQILNLFKKKNKQLRKQIKRYLMLPILVFQCIGAILAVIYRAFHSATPDIQHTYDHVACINYQLELHVKNSAIFQKKIDKKSFQSFQI